MPNVRGNRRCLLVGTRNKLFNLYNDANQIAYWPGQETSGTNAPAYDENGRNSNLDGTYIGPTLNQSMGGRLGVAPSYDAVTDRSDIYSAALNAVFNGSVGTLIAFAKVRASSVWTDSTQRRIVEFRNTSSNRIILEKSSANNTLGCSHFTSGSARSVTIGSISYTDAFMITSTWDTGIADTLKLFINGVEAGTPATSLGTWTGDLATPGCVIGSISSTSPGVLWDGLINHVAVYDVVLSDAQILSIAQSGGVA